MAEPLKKTLLILGAGTDQIYPIKIAHDLNLRVIAADINPDAPGFKFADEIAIVSNRDIDGLKRVCDESSSRGYPVAGVLVMGADIPQIAAELSLYLNVPGPTINTGLLTTNKYLMKKKLRDAGIPVPNFTLINDFPSLLFCMKEYGSKKCVIKPTDRSGARGVYVVNINMQDLESLYIDAKNESLSGEVILEEYIDGPQISTESIIWRGKAYTPGFVDRNYEMLERFAPSVIENGGIHPSQVNSELKRSVEELVEKSANALGIVDGVAKGDIVISKNGRPMLIEMAARLSGGDFSESLIPLGCGVNIVRAAIQIAIKEQPNISQLANLHEVTVANRYFFSAPGKLRAIHGLSEARKFNWIKKLEVYVYPGDVIGEIKYHAGRLGVFIVEAKNRRELEQRIDKIYKTVIFEVE